MGGKEEYFEKYYCYLKCFIPGTNPDSVKIKIGFAIIFTGI